ncbi:MAG: type II toxin-antitoxin system RelE/ParE family toxin [Phycisphaerales bacterium]|nr:type II toxin-antitoxin system RelE/ParE family toxin [Phycisphaerales bacterium]
MAGTPRTSRRRPQRFEVRQTSRAQRDLLEIHAYIAQASPVNASRFLHRLIRAIDKLERMPHAHRFAPEAHETGGEVRQAIVGRYRVVYEIVGDVVIVHTVRHSARLPLNDLKQT